MVLKQQHQELVEASTSGLSDSHKIELDAISSILRNIQNGQVHWPSSSMGTLTVRLSDSDDEEEGNCLLQEYALHADSHVESVILHRKKELSKEVNYIDAKIMKTMNSVQNMEAKVGQFAVLDYRAVVLPLVKSLLKSHLEGEAEKDAMQKSDAAREAFLAELAKDKESPSTKEAELLKQSRDKPKDKKRLKDQKKPKDVKQEVELQHQAKLEAKECNLAEALELQWRAEEEAREQHLAEQCQKKLAQDSHVQKRTSEDDGCGVIESFCSLSAKSSTIAPKFFHPGPSDTHTEGCLLLPEMKPKSFFDLSPPVNTLTDELTISSKALQSSRSCSYAQSITGATDAGDVIVMSPQQLQIEMET
ncbi:unnamed protein product [Sphagnum balticum]